MQIMTGRIGGLFTRPASFLFRPAEPQVLGVKGRLFGDEGKARVVYDLARTYEPQNIFAVVRSNGGPNRGGNILTPNGGEFCHNQLNSAASLGVPTVLAGDFLLDPGKLVGEAANLAKLTANSTSPIYLENEKNRILANTRIDTGISLILDVDIMVNHMEELLHGDGTIGVGIYQASLHQGRLTFADIFAPGSLPEKVRAIVEEKIRTALQLIESANGDGQKQKLLKNKFRDFCGKLPGEDHVSIDEIISQVTNQNVINLTRNSRQLAVCRLKEGQSAWDYLKTGLKRKKNRVIFEWSQGDLLSPKFGFYPHVTGTPCTADWCSQLLTANGLDRYGVKLYSVIRPYIYYHDDFRPMPTKITNPEINPVLLGFKDKSSSNISWPANSLIGWMDSVFLRYAMSLNPRRPNWEEALVVTNLDRLSGLDNIMLGTGYSMPLPADPAVAAAFIRDGSGNVINIDKQAVTALSLPQRKQLTEALSGARPLYTSLPGWPEDIARNKTGYYGLQANARNYLKALEVITGLLVAFTSVGRHPSQFLKHSF